MRALCLSLTLLAAVAWTRPAAAAFVAVDLVFDHQAFTEGDRDVWGVWLRTSDDVQVSSLYVVLATNELFTVALDLGNPALDPLQSSIDPYELGAATPVLSAGGFWPAPLVGPNGSGRIALLTGEPLTNPREVIIVPGLAPAEDIFGVDSIYATDALSAPLSILSHSGPFVPFCDIQTCPIPAAPQTQIRVLWVVPEPSGLALVLEAAVVLGLLAKRR